MNTKADVIDLIERLIQLAWTVYHHDASKSLVKFSKSVIYRIPYSWSQLKDIMRRVGEVTYVDAHNRMGRGRGECCFATREIMMKAKDELDGFEINGKRIQLYIKVSFIIHFV